MSLNAFIILRSVTRHRIVNFTPIALRTFSNKSREEKRWNWKTPGVVALFGSVVVGSALSEKLDNRQKGKPATEKVVIEAGTKRPDLPTYRAEEISKHDSKSSFWVTYKQGVYDITDFLPSHPGGEQILNAAGLSIEPFWNVYGMHKTDDIYKLLESYRIGNLHDDDLVDHSDEELWAREPRRDPRLLVKTARPFNAETPPQYQIQHFDTPNELFYVRQHMPVPELDPATHQLTVVVRDAAGREKKTILSMQQLQQLPARRLRAALMCAGNRRTEMHQVKPVKGIAWTTGAISNAVWEGVYLRDLLILCGVDIENTEGKHVIFTGADMDATGAKFSSSVPLALALAAGVLLARAMNGAPLAPDRGRPLRALVPGAAAVRSVKWLESITISDEESSSHWHQKDYRSFNPSVTWETADFSRAPPVYSVPVTSAICSPQHGDTVVVKDGCVNVKGYAYSGGGAKIIRVDVSGDRGKTWVEATLTATDDAPPPRHYAWTLWGVNLPAPAQHEMEIWVKATDSNCNTQPEKFDDIWNIRGILANAYHKISIKLKR